MVNLLFVKEDLKILWEFERDLWKKFGFRKL